jgi:hypothetical protein
MDAWAIAFMGELCDVYLVREVAERELARRNARYGDADKRELVSLVRNTAGAQLTAVAPISPATLAALDRAAQTQIPLDPRIAGVVGDNLWELITGKPRPPGWPHGVPPHPKASDGACNGTGGENRANGEKHG